MIKFSAYNYKLLFGKRKFIINSLLLAALFLLSIFLLFPWEKLMIVSTTIFLDRDLGRAIELLNGKLIFFGSEITGGGNLPGPFFYFLLAPPLLLGLGFLGCFYWMCMLMALGGVFGWYYFNSKFDSLTGFLWLILYIMCYALQSLLAKFLNPSFAPALIVLINIFSLIAFSESDEKRRGHAFIYACFFTGLSIQTHYSGITSLFSLIFLQVFAKTYKLKAVSYKSFIFGLAAFGATMAPYLIWLGLKKLGIVIGQPNPYDGVASNSIPSLWDHFKVTWEAPLLDFLHLGFKKIFTVAPLIIVAALLLTRTLVKKKSQLTVVSGEDTNLSASVTVLTVSLIFAFLPFSFYFFVPQGHRYGTPFAISMLFLICVMWKRIVNSAVALRFFNIIGFLALLVIGLWNYSAFVGYSKFFDGILQHLTIFVVIVLMAVLFYFGKNKKYKPALLFSFALTGFLAVGGNLLQRNFAGQIHQDVNSMRYRLWMLVLPEIYNRTGWNYDEAREKIYFVNMYREQSFRYIYNELEKKEPSKKLEKGDLPDGYFMGLGKPNDRKTNEWIIEQPIAEEIKAGIISGNIYIGEHKADAKPFFAPYFIRDKKLFTDSFHNVGWGYNSIPEENLLHGFAETTGVKKIEDNQYLFKWNECPNKNYYCDTGVIVRIKNTKPNVFDFELNIVGLPLSQNTKWVNPMWTQSWIAPYLEVKCGQVRKSLPILSSIGYNRKNLFFDLNFKYPTSNNSILAPFKKSFEIYCSGPLSEIVVGRDSSEVESEQELLILPKTRIVLKL